MKKPTIKELKTEIDKERERLDLTVRQLNFSTRMLDSIGIAFSNYVKYKGDEQNFKDYLENNKNLHKLNKEEDEDRKKGHLEGINTVSDKEVREESSGKE
tara:strand:+ start:938 stop:1237 length:300 start_codon:yes stop_codon:yes gene_type:complete